MIEGRLINLRPIEDEDAAVFHRWFNDPEVTRFLGAIAFPNVSMADERAFIQRLRGDTSRRNWMIALKDGAPIGTVLVREFNWEARSCEVGIAIGEKEHWSKGYGGEALELMQRLVFDSLNLHKLWLTCAAYNERGLRAYRRIGFVEDGRLRDDRFIEGRYHDTVVMSILDHEWRARQAGSVDQPPIRETQDLR